MQPLSVWRCFPSHLWETGGTLGHRRGGAHSVPLPDGQGQRWHSMELPVGMGCPVTCPGQCSHLYLQVAPEHLRWGACTFHVNSFASSRMEVAAPGSWLPHWTAQVQSPGPPAFLGFLSFSGSQQGEPAGGNPRVSSFSLSGTHTHILCLRLVPEPRQLPPVAHPPASSSGGLIGGGTPDSSLGHACFCGSWDRCRLPGLRALTGMGVRPL